MVIRAVRDAATGSCQVLGFAGVFQDMHIVYLTITILAACTNGFAAALSLSGADSVKATADQVQVSQRWMVPFGTLLGAGALGLLAGLAVPMIGVAAATGLILYFIGAVGAHLRARDTGFGGAVFFLLLAIAALLTNVVYHAGR